MLITHDNDIRMCIDALYVFACLVVMYDTHLSSCCLWEVK